MTLGLGIDTSFDDTAVSLVEDGRHILCNLTVSQFAEHAEFGGVIPERASRLHVQMIFPLVERALAETGKDLSAIDYVAVTNEPGLVGSLLVGVTVGKALAMALGKPLVGVNHLEAHVHSGFMAEPELRYPFLSLLISGANTLILESRAHGDHRQIGATRDDAVGECIDKCGRHLGLGLPAGPALQKLAFEGDPKVRPFPRPFIDAAHFDFSFSGLKTAVLYALRDDPSLRREDVAASLLDAIADVLVTKTMKAAARTGLNTIVLCGGAAASAQVRAAFAERAEPQGLRVIYPGLALCTDNAAMVAGLGFEHHRRREHAGFALEVRSTVSWKSSDFADSQNA
ncbi:MAG: tRNA (adenosine(37)-N6)-threonylcarbamoyltransferase complex transferase subunit TsaD [Planctomycetes bacterium]|nr:tRNA (adenosine(37)-N6)-threonylcarbamoyltransferase complex transferase subunit TsaD [Planctomycetota bacterium]